MHEPTSQFRLQIFSRRTEKGTNSRMIAQRADRNIFAKIVVMAQTRTFDMRLLFSHSLGPVPWPLTNADGTQVRTKKSALLAALEADVMPVEEVPTNAAHIVDTMALIQGMNAVSGTFSDFARSVFSRLLSSGGKAASVSEAPQRIDFVCDQYFDHSIKNAERRRQAQAVCSEPLRMMILRPDQETPRQWKRYLSDGQNKTDLLTFECLLRSFDRCFHSSSCTAYKGRCRTVRNERRQLEAPLHSIQVPFEQPL